MPAPPGFKQMWDALALRVTRLEQRMNNVLAHTGLSVPSQGVVQCTGSLEVTGDLTVSGTLELPNASVNNAALVNPVVPGIGRASSTNFGLAAGTLNELAGIDLTVPAGCSQLLATCTARMYAIDPNTTGGSNGSGGDSWYVTPKLGTQSSVATPTPVSGSNGFNTAVCTDSFTVTGLTPGSTIRLSVYGCSGYQAIAANSSNYAVVAAELKWLR